MGKYLDPNLENLQQTLSSVFTIPVYQRPYKWEEEQIKELFVDMIAEFQDEGSFFFGTVFLNLTGNISSSKAIYEIVDGQQRMTTIALIMLDMYSKMHILGLDETDTDVKGIKDYLWKEHDLSNDRECRLISSGSLERKTLEDIFNWCLDNPAKFLAKINSIDKESIGVFEKNFYQNVKYIDKCIDLYIVNNDSGRFAGKSSSDRIKLFYRYLKENVNVITITLTNGINEDRKKLFEIFESINAKGRKLDQIDLIKSYIFQNLPTSDYDQYLTKWGELIKKTNDNLEDYLTIFIRAKVKYYKQSITINNFKDCARLYLKPYYNRDSIAETLEAFIDDMIAGVDNYKRLNEVNNYIIKESAEFCFYTDALRHLNYNHPKPLLFRAYCDYSNVENTDIQKKELINLSRCILVFMFLFQTLQQKDSKETSTRFEALMNIVYANKQNYYKAIIQKLNKELELAAITDEQIYDSIKKHIGYETHAKNETKLILAIYEFSTEDKCFYDKMSYVLKESKIQVDHICVRKPEQDDKKYLYYMQRDDEGNDILHLKEGSDFDSDINVSNGMDYELFIGRVLNRTGNLQLMWSTENKAKSNGVIELPSYENFYTYNQIQERAESIARKLKKLKFFKIEI